MPRDRDEQENLDRFLAEYRRPWSDAARKVERAVLGHEVGLNGYTTVEQARMLGDQLGLSPRTRLLDVGAGRGWPGSYLAQSRGCRLVTTDIPFDAPLAAKRHLESWAVHGQAHAVSADGRALPFRSARFGAVVHADVLC